MIPLIVAIATHVNGVHTERAATEVILPVSALDRSKLQRTEAADIALAFDKRTIDSAGLGEDSTARDVAEQFRRRVGLACGGTEDTAAHGDESIAAAAADVAAAADKDVARRGVVRDIVSSGDGYGAAVVDDCAIGQVGVDRITRKRAGSPVGRDRPVPPATFQYDPVVCAWAADTPATTSTATARPARILFLHIYLTSFVVINTVCKRTIELTTRCALALAICPPC